MTLGLDLDIEHIRAAKYIRHALRAQNLSTGGLRGHAGGNVYR